MNFENLPLAEMANRPTPYYMYDLRVLRSTLDAINRASSVNPKFCVHYAMKACYDASVMNAVREAGLGLDTVSGGEIEIAINNGFDPATIMYAGVGKTDREIRMALRAEIGVFNVESLPELEAIAELAASMGCTARVALRINPEIDAHTHHYITTGVPENKFGINLDSLDMAVDRAMSLPSIDFCGLHFHIGSQITVTEPFAVLCDRVNTIVGRLAARGVRLRSINVGGGLAVDYEDPLGHPIPDFDSYFATIAKRLDTSLADEVHFELGRAVVAQCGWLVSRVVYVKNGGDRTFAILDAGMTELIRPALYQARHAVINITGETEERAKQKVDVVGPVCESADEFGKDYVLASPRRGDIVVIGSAGAYGEVMSSHYNARHLEPTFIIGNDQAL